MEETTVRVSAFVIDWHKALVKLGLAESMSAAARLVKAGAVEVDGEKLETRRTLEVGERFIVKAGRRAKVMVLEMGGAK